MAIRFVYCEGVICINAKNESDAPLAVHAHRILLEKFSEYTDTKYIERSVNGTGISLAVFTHLFIREMKEHVKIVKAEMLLNPPEEQDVRVAKELLLKLESSKIIDLR